MYYLSVMLFVMALFIGLFNSELRLTEGYMFILILSIFNLLIWIYATIKKEIKN